MERLIISHFQLMAVVPEAQGWSEQMKVDHLLGQWSVRVSGWGGELICVSVRVTVPGSVQAETAWLLPRSHACGPCSQWYHLCMKVGLGTPEWLLEQN